jgi:hypothetical protein
VSDWVCFSALTVSYKSSRTDARPSVRAPFLLSCWVTESTRSFPPTVRLQFGYRADFLWQVHANYEAWLVPAVPGSGHAIFAWTVNRSIFEWTGIFFSNFIGSTSCDFQWSDRAIYIHEFG